METTIPDELLELKARLDQWRATRKHARQAIPDELRNAALEMSGKYPRKLIRRILKLDPWRLVRYQAANQPIRKSAQPQPQTEFYKLPAEALSPQPAVSFPINGCRIQIERPDGARLTVSLPPSESSSIHRLCADFLRGSAQ
jgi:hypothetical protein